MRRVFAITAVIAFALALPAVAAAQEHKDEHKGPPPGAGGHPPPHPQFQPPPGHPPGPGPQFKKPGPPGPHPPGPPGPPNPQFQPVHPPGPPGPGPGPQNFHGHPWHQFHPAHPFIYPPGWSYRRWGIGAILPPLFLVPDYYFMDWAELGLPPPPPGDQWVRYGPDLLLVNVSTGQIDDVIYDAFY